MLVGEAADPYVSSDISVTSVEMSNLPEELARARFYEPRQEGSEAAIAQRLEAFRARRERERRKL